MDHEWFSANQQLDSFLFPNQKTEKTKKKTARFENDWLPVVIKKKDMKILSYVPKADLVGRQKTAPFKVGHSSDHIRPRPRHLALVWGGLCNNPFVKVDDAQQNGSLNLCSSFVIRRGDWFKESTVADGRFASGWIN